MGCVNFKAQYERLPGQRNPVILAADTAFSISDVEALTVLFKRISNSIKADGKISKEEFKLALLKDSQRQSLFADRIFTLFDVRQKGKIYLADFVKALNVFHPDTPIEAKIDFSFKLYDLNGDGVIERQEVRDMVVAILRELQHEPTDELLEYILNKTFMDVDVNRDGKIDIDEWRGFVIRNPGVIKRNMTISHLPEVTTIFPEFVFHSTVKDDELDVFEQPGASSSTAQPGGSTSIAQPAAQPGASTSTAQPGYLTSTVQLAALSEGSTTSTVQPAALSEGSTTSTVQPAALPECSTSTVQLAALSEGSTASTVQPAALSEGSTTSTVQPAAPPECSTSTARPAVQTGCSTSTAKTDAPPECSTSTAQPGGSTSAAQPEAQPRRSSSTSSDEFKHFF